MHAHQKMAWLDAGKVETKEGGGERKKKAPTKAATKRRRRPITRHQQKYPLCQSAYGDASNNVPRRNAKCIYHGF